jgi:amino acid transporter
MGDTLTTLVSGAMVMAYFTAGLFFLRFWKDTRDRLFGSFAAAFFLLAIQRALLTLFVDQRGGDDSGTLLYGIRLIAFLVILWAIVDKNRKRD